MHKELLETYTKLAIKWVIQACVILIREIEFFLFIIDVLEIEF